MDALAGLAFGIIVVNAIRNLGVQEPGEVAKQTVRGRDLQLPAHGTDLCAGDPDRRPEPGDF